MKSRALLLCLLLLGLGNLRSYSQSDLCNIRISLLTCGPGMDLYSVWGHSALRVEDKTAGTDIIYNYGTFDFEDPEFYTKYIQGKLLYFVSTQPFLNFVQEYEYENRFIIEQQLALTCEEKERLYLALRENEKEENKYYLYEFLFDNCSTRLRDIVRNAGSDSVHFKRILPNPGPTFRIMIHEYLDKAGQFWSGFGIDLLLGSGMDKKATNEQAMFLPDYLMKGFDSGVVRHQPLVNTKKIILPSVETKREKDTAITPLMVSIALLIVGLLLVLVRNKSYSGFAGWFDSIYFFLLGFTGCFVMFMWFGTEHALCRDNYNLAWALPTHILVPFFLRSSATWIKKYFLATAIISAVVLITSPIYPQGMNSAFFPLVLLSGIRSAYRAFKK